MRASKERGEAFGHTLLTGFAGCGKTSLAAVIAAEMQVDFVPLFASSITKPTDLKEILRTRLNSDGYVFDEPEPKIPSEIKPTIIFIDEIHNLPLKVRETLYTVMEDRTYDEEETNPWNKRKTVSKTWVPKFTLIGATTREGVLEKPFLDRFKYTFKVEKYTDAECEFFVQTTINKAAEKLHTLTISPEAKAGIARRSRGTARTTIQLTERCIDYFIGSGLDGEIKEDLITKAFRDMKIDSNGLNYIDYRILLYLHKCYRPIGVKGIATALEETTDSIEKNYEPHLVSKGLIMRTPNGRVISEDGVKYLRDRNLIKFDNKRVMKDEG